MKKTLLTFIGLIYSFSGFSQKSGYKEIIIGQKINNIINKGEHTIMASKNNPTLYAVFPTDEVICGMYVDQISITTSPDSLITEIKLYTKTTKLPDFDAWQKREHGVLNNIVENVGKASYTNLGSGKMDLVAIWEFEETKTSLALRWSDVSTFATDVDSKFLFYWVKDNAATGNKMW